MQVNASAPAVVRESVEIEASPEDVWAVLSDIPGWPSWNPDVRSASIEGPLTRGTTFRWKAGPGTITSRLDEVEPPRLIAWTGRTFGITGIHVYRLEPHGDATLVRSEESWDGLAVRLLRRPMQKTLHTAIASGLRHLKARVER